MMKLVAEESAPRTEVEVMSIKGINKDIAKVRFVLKHPIYGNVKITQPVDRASLKFPDPNQTLFIAYSLMEKRFKQAKQELQARARG